MLLALSYLGSLGRPGPLESFLYAKWSLLYTLVTRYSPTGLSSEGPGVAHRVIRMT